MKKLLLAGVAVLAFCTTAHAQDDVPLKELPSYMLGYWCVDGDAEHYKRCSGNRDLEIQRQSYVTDVPCVLKNIAWRPDKTYLISVECKAEGSQRTVQHTKVARLDGDVLYWSYPPVVASTSELDYTDIQRALDTYKQNEARFNRDFVNKTIAFQGSVDKVVKSVIGGGYYVTFGGDTVKCDLQDQATIDKAIDWNPGQRVDVLGTIDDVWFGTLHLKHCTLNAVSAAS